MSISNKLPKPHILKPFVGYSPIIGNEVLPSPPTDYQNLSPYISFSCISLPLMNIHSLLVILSHLNSSNIFNGSHITRQYFKFINLKFKFWIQITLPCQSVTIELSKKSWNSGHIVNMGWTEKKTRRSELICKNEKQKKDSNWIEGERPCMIQFSLQFCMN